MSDATANKSDRPLDDVMMAMDVVDTLRHREGLVERELSEDSRDETLLARLREIYANQGIEVTDRVLREGVAALKEERFVYESPTGGFNLWLAKAYVRRTSWGKWVGIAVLVVVVGIAGWYFGIERPRQAAIADRHIALTETLPADLKKVSARIEKATEDNTALERSKSLVRSGLASASAGKLEPARKALADLKALEDEINLAYTVEIVVESGKPSGFWRKPKVNQKARNYYLVVQAVDRAGKVLERRIRNQETGKFEAVKKWGQRVSKSTFDRVRRDKADDGIIQLSKLGEKRAGTLTRDWRLPVKEGAITRW